MFYMETLGDERTFSLPKVCKQNLWLLHAAHVCKQNLRLEPLARIESWILFCAMSSSLYTEPSVRASGYLRILLILSTELYQPMLVQ